jgi:small-conductance mechanosensitive channel
MDKFLSLFTHFHLGNAIRAGAVILLGFFIAKIISVSLKRAFRSRLKPHQLMVLRRISFYLIFILFFITGIQELGFQLGALLGATGILTVAIGIASQTSMSNFVSGVFIIGEKPFEIGDTVQINKIQGEVFAINFLSVKIKTEDNKMIRIPNEILIKTPITNLSYFPIRRLDLLITLGFKETISHLKTIFLKVAEQNNYVLDKPESRVSVNELSDEGVTLNFSVWCNKNNFKDLKDSIQEEIKNALEHNQIELPTKRIFSSTDPLLVKMI